ncbi:hypothetical protein NST28_16535 [Paenibacillus sp. FSL R10-2791]|uniref:hypothetical protein n=1 Tax=Paenibacillus sp. FSL R10-2791 TaxID=2954695 RepID=UPI0030F6EA8B
MSPNKTNPLDWMNEDPFFKKKLSLKALEEQWKLDPNQIDGYVEKVIREATAATSSSFMNETSSLSFEHIDTHNHLITKIRIPSGIHPESIWAQINRTQIKLTGLGKDHSEIISCQFPSFQIRAEALISKVPCNSEWLKCQREDSKISTSVIYKISL